MNLSNYIKKVKIRNKIQIIITIIYNIKFYSRLTQRNIHILFFNINLFLYAVIQLIYKI